VPLSSFGRAPNVEEIHLANLLHDQ